MISGFTDLNKNCRNFHGIMRLAGEKLSDILHEKYVLPLEKSERDLQSVHIAVRDLARAFNDGTEDISIRTHATIVMKRQRRITGMTKKRIIGSDFFSLGSLKLWLYRCLPCKRQPYGCLRGNRKKEIG